MLDDQLKQSAKSGDTEAVVSIIDETPLEQRSHWLYLALYWATVGNQTETMHVLLEHGADVNSTHFVGQRILTAAVIEGNIEAVRILLDAGANVSAQEPWEKSAVEYAQLYGHREIASLLEKHLAEITENQTKTSITRAVPNHILRYHHWQPQSGIFEFALEDCLDYFSQQLLNHAQPNDIRAILESLHAHSKHPSPTVIADKRPTKFTYMAASLLEQWKGRAYCPQCERWFEDAGLIFERWQRGRRPLEGGEGRRFYCPNNHLILDVVDMRA